MTPFFPRPRAAMTRRTLLTVTVLAGLAAAVVAGPAAPAPPAPPDKAVLDAEAARVATIAAVRPAVVAVCFYGGEGCGSGVLIDPAGYALTNYHVVEPTGPVLQCGLPDGKLYDAVLVGQDRVGDVALIKLLPREPGKAFPFVQLADSDTVRVGDWSLAMGNPFGLSADFTPTVTCGVVSGVNRYQPPEGKGTLEYTDCIQVDTSINPGNSGGPLFDMAGGLIGINGRGSFDKRGRVNSGVGYAISTNQIRNFLGHLHAGLDCDHASLGATVATENEDGDLARMVVRQMLSDADAGRRGVEPGDTLVAFAGRPVTSVNQYKNVLGVFPKAWRLPLSYRRGTDTKEVLVRLAGVLETPAEGEKPDAKPNGGKGPRPGQPTPPRRAGADKSPAKKLYEPKAGFANYHFNREAVAALRAATAKTSDLTAFAGPWSAAGTVELADRRGAATLTWGETADGQAEVRLSRNGVTDAVRPLAAGVPLGELQLPQGSGGMLAALYQYRRLLTLWDKGFEAGFDHGGHAPLYPPAAKPGGRARDRRVDCEVVHTKHGPFEATWFYDLSTRRLIGGESVATKDEDPCELYFADYKPVDGVELPHTVRVRVGDKPYATVTIDAYKLGKK